LRFSLLLASAAALAIAGCNAGTSSSSNSNSGTASTDVGSNIQDKDLQGEVLAALDDAPKNGLTKDLFLKGQLPSDPGERRTVLIQAIEAYASALANGKVDPTKIRDVYTLPRPKIDVTAGLQQALQQHQLRQWLASLPPQTPEYQALSNAFVQLVQRSPDLPDQQIPSGKTIKPGDSDPRIPAIAANLTAEGYLNSAPQPQPQQVQPRPQRTRHGKKPSSRSAAPSQPSNRYSPQLVAAVKQWQSDSGVKPDGVIGNDTIQALNASPKDRARTLAIAMERLRWLQRDPPATRIDVNTAASFLQYLRDGKQVDYRKVVEGEPGKETPQLQAPMFQLVANPTWTVPHSIDDEIASKGGSWLAANGFSQKNGQWVQASGPKNSLGIVKFDLKDDQAIYLHDTPAKSLFQLDDRHRSHGCVRVEDAIGFAHEIARDEGVDDKFSQAMAGTDQSFVALPKPIPVRLMYHTAYLGNDGRVHFANDVYGWDDDVAAALGYAKRARAAQQQQTGDIGP
jgi:murein L,D-transpeptidase YcbB/YkuD